MALVAKSTHKPVKGTVSQVNAEVAEVMNGAFADASNKAEFPVTANYPNGYEGYEGEITLPTNGDGEFTEFTPEAFMNHARAWGNEQSPKITVSKVGRRNLPADVVLFDFQPHNPEAAKRGRKTDAERASKAGYGTDVEAWKRDGKPTEKPAKATAGKK